MKEVTIENDNKWHDVKEELPLLLGKYGYRSRKVIACWGDGSEENMAEMEFVEETIRDKAVQRFKWQGRISPWEITHWMYFPKPPKFD